MTVLAAELSDLRGWSAQVGRAGAGCAAASDYLAGHVTDGEFGMILELVTMDYERLIPVFTEALATEAARLETTGRSIEAIVRDYAATDARVAQDLGVGAVLCDDSLVGVGFYDVATVLPIRTPSSDTAALPTISFGYLLDKICDLTLWIIGVDPRDYVTRWIAGDIEKAALQASAWEQVSRCLEGVDVNLTRGQGAIDRTWRGAAATSAAGYLDQWLTVLPRQSAAAAGIAAHLRDMIRGAVDLAQNVVDLIRLIVSICSAALSSSYIPLWGQWKAVETIKEAWELFKTARKAIQAFWQILTTIKDLLISLVHDVTAEGLPGAPLVPTAP